MGGSVGKLLSLHTLRHKASADLLPRDRLESFWARLWFGLGTFLGFACLLGDSTGSFFKRRRGLKREGDVSSKAPLLDTLPFAIMVFLFGQIFLGDSLLSQNELILPMLIMIVITPILHRSFNLIGYYIGWKDVPY